MKNCERHAVPLGPDDYCPICIAQMLLAPEEKKSLGALGNYELIEELGRGGMGVVYRARQTELNREVALKLLPAGSLASEEHIRRFRREAEMAARLKHPNIVQIFEAGEVEGEAFYSMELVRGGSLSDHFTPGRISPVEAARLVRELAFAIAHAHGHGVLHRDLKPSNILIDEMGRSKVADFGLARPFDGSADPAETRSFGSPAYLAPELVRDPRAASPASDLYSLGGILYHLLCSRPPFVSSSLDELLRQVRECEPPAPRLLNPTVAKDLQKVCLKALDKHPGRRYANAKEFGEDLDRFLEGKPVHARPVGPLVKGWRAAKRAPWLTACLIALLLVMVAGTAGVISQSRIANERSEEVREKAEALRLRLYASDILGASLALQRGNITLAEGLLERWNTSQTDNDPRGFEWWFLKYLARPTAHQVVAQRAATVTSVAASGDGRRIAVSDQSGRTSLHSADGKEMQVLRWHGEEVAFLPPGSGADLVLGDPAGIIRWCDSGMKVIAEFPGRQFSLAAQVPRAVVGSAPRYHWWGQAASVAVVDWQERRRLRELPGMWRHAVISPDGTQVALAGVEGGVCLVDVETGKATELPAPALAWGLSFSPDGKKLSAGSRTAALIWNLQSPGSQPLFFPHPLTVWTTAFSPDATQLLTACSDRHARLWKVGDPSAPPRLLSGHRSEIWCAAFLGAAGAVVTGGKDCEAIRWDTSVAEDSGAVFPHTGRYAPSFSPDSRWFLIQAGNHPKLHDSENGLTVDLPDGLQALGFSPDGKSIWLAETRSGATGRAPVSATWKFRRFPQDTESGGFHSIQNLSEGHWIARVQKNGEIRLIDPGVGKVIRSLAGPMPGMRHAIAGNATGRFVAVAGDGEKGVVLHDLEKGTNARLLPESSYYYVCAAFSPDGEILAAGDLDGPIRVWDVRHRRLLATLPGHPEETSGLAFSPDGRTLASIGNHQGLKLWHVPTWSEVHSVDMEQTGFSLVFSPDGTKLAVTLGKSRNERVEWLPAPKSR